MPGEDNEEVLFDGSPPVDRQHGLGGETCPVAAVGHNDGVFYFLDAVGQLRPITPRGMTFPEILALFGGDEGWLLEYCPKYGRDDNRPAKWCKDKASRFLIRTAMDAGLIDVDRAKRGVGVWETASGKLVIHCGQELYYDGAWRRSGCRIEDKIYVALATIDRPGKTPASEAEVARLFRFIRDQWNWTNREVDARLLLGYLGCAAILGTLKWRPHIWVTAPAGAGKSRLDELKKALLGSIVESSSAPSPAGVRGMLGCSAKPLLLDEVEPEDQKGHADGLVALARLASTDSQGGITRGRSDGSSQTWFVRSCFAFTSIERPPFGSADYGRISVLRMDPLRKLSRQETIDFEAVFSELSGIGPEFRRRMIDGYARFQENVATYATVMAARGENRRTSDQLSTLFAAADALLSDKQTTPEGAGKILDMVVFDDFTGGEEAKRENACLEHLLTSKVTISTTYGTNLATILSLIAVAEPTIDDPANKNLMRYGVKLHKSGEEEYLVIANSGRGIEEIFKGTSWRGGGHKEALRLHPATRNFGQSNKVRIEGMLMRCSWLRLADIDLDRRTAPSLSDLGDS